VIGDLNCEAYLVGARNLLPSEASQRELLPDPAIVDLPSRGKSHANLGFKMSIIAPWDLDWRMLQQEYEDCKATMATISLAWS
jgi:hypothetical protein